MYRAYWELLNELAEKQLIIINYRILRVAFLIQLVFVYQNRKRINGLHCTAQCGALLSAGINFTCSQQRIPGTVLHLDFDWSELQTRL